MEDLNDIEVINGKFYKKIKEYEHFTLFQDENGNKTCFDDFDLGKIKKMYVKDLK